MKMFTRIIQLIMIFIPITLLGFLCEQNFVPSGVFEIKHNVHETSAYIDALAPQQRIETPRKENDGWSQAIIGDPVFFFLHPHIDFLKLSFEIWFKNDTVPIVEFGGRVNTNPEAYDLIPLHNLLLDSLSWKKISDGALTLLQKEQKYNSIQEFFDKPPSRDQVAVYKADYPSLLRISGYQASNQQRAINVSLRGSHEIKTYIKNETLEYAFDYMDMNRDEGADPIVITLFNESGNPVADARVQDDGDVRGDAIPSKMQKLELSVPGLQEGVYKLTINAGRDIFFRKIQTSQQKIVFLHSIYIGDETGYREHQTPVRFWTSSERLHIQTRHAEGVQDIKINGNIQTISEPYKMYEFAGSEGVVSVDIQKGDLEVYVDSPIAFDSSQYFNPDPVAIRPYTNLSALGINYVLTTYTPPRKEGSWLVKDVTFDSNNLILEKGSWKFTFSTPEIETLGAKMFVKEINIKWYK